ALTPRSQVGCVGISYPTNIKSSASSISAIAMLRTVARFTFMVRFLFGKGHLYHTKTRLARTRVCRRGLYLLMLSFFEAQQRNNYYFCTLSYQKDIYAP